MHICIRIILNLILDIEQTESLPPLDDHYVKTGLLSKMLEEAFKDPNSTFEHIGFLLFDMEIHSLISTLHFDASSLSPSTLLQKNIFVYRLYEKLVECGMPVTGEDVKLALSMLPAENLKLFTFLISQCGTWPDDEVALRISKVGVL